MLPDVQYPGKMRSNSRLAALNLRLENLGTVLITALAMCGVTVVGIVDYLTGYEISFSLFYLAPVSMAAWYSGRRAGVAIAALSCACWYAANLASGSEYSHPAIPAWNALVRLGYFLVTTLLLASLREHLRTEQQLARIDGLTGLHGRRSFEDRLEHDIELAQRHRTPITIAYVDLDDFKAVNDNRGHAEGDRVLATAGRVIRSSVRQTDTASRLGGDEFALVLPETDDRGARQVVTKMVSDLLAAFEAGRWNVGCSVGVVTFFNPAVTATQAVAAADALMYEVKRGGKRAIEFRVVPGVAAPPAADR